MTGAGLFSRRGFLQAAGALSAAASAPSVRAAGSAAASGALACDLLVIGAGAAGLAAAVSARELGIRRVVVLEKSPVIGGHSILSTGYASAVRRGKSSEKEFRAAVRAFAADLARVGGGRNVPALYEKLARESGGALDWLEKLGVRWEPLPVQTTAGLTVRSYTSGPVRAGFDYVITLCQAALRAGVEIRRSTRALSIARRNAAGLIEVRAERGGTPWRCLARAAVIATGGYGANRELVSKLVPTLGPRYITTADPESKGLDTATGDGLLMAQAIGAAATGLECIQAIPFWGGRMTDYVGADIYLDREGRRFVNEGANWKTIASAISALPGGRCWVVTDSRSKQGAGRSVKLMKGAVKTAGSVAEMARGMSVRESVLQATLVRYNAFARSGRDTDFGKTMFTQEISRPPFYYGEEQLYVHYCCGGIAIDERARVLDLEGRPIPGLYAAGEATGGVHGEDRVGGCSIPDCIVFGRTASREAAKLIARGE